MHFFGPHLSFAWSSLFLLHALALIIFILAKVWLMPILTLSLLTVIWTDNSVAFPFDEEGSTIFASCLLCGPEATFFYLARPMFQALLLKHASFCKLFAGLGSASESATSLLLSDFRFVLFTLSSPPPSFSHSLAHLAKTFFFISPTIRLQWVPGRSFFS